MYKLYQQIYFWKECLHGKGWTLDSLNIRGTKVTLKGVGLALETLPHLQTLSLNWTTKIVRLIAQMSRNEIMASHFVAPVARHLRLTELIFEEDDAASLYVKGDLAAALQLCPFIVHLGIGNPDQISQEDFEAVVELKHLRSLTFGSGEKGDFQTGILPFLQRLGSKSLETLKIGYTKSVDVGAIVEYCPKLRYLKLGALSEYRPSREVSSFRSLSKLEYLSVS